MRETAGRTFQGKGTAEARNPGWQGLVLDKEAEGLENWWEMRPGRVAGGRQGLCFTQEPQGSSSSGRGGWI